MDPAATEVETPAGTDGRGTTIEVGTAYWAAIMLFGIIVFGGFLLLSLTLEGIFLDLCLFVIVLLYSYGLSFHSRIFITDEGVTLRNWWGTYFVRWNDIRKYLADIKNSNYALITDQGRLPLPALWCWSGPDRHRAKHRLQQKLDEHDIPRETTVRVEFMLRPRNLTAHQERA